MKRRTARPPARVAVRDGELVVIHTADPFTFEPGHRMRAAHCLVCHQVIGGQLASVIGVGTLGGAACDCSAVHSELFLLHAAHLPLTPAQMETTIRAGLSHDHPWNW